MSQITIEDIWNSILSSDSGHIKVLLPNTRAVSIVRKALAKYKYRELQDSPQIKDFLGEFTLAYEPEALPDTTNVILHIRRVSPEPNMITIQGSILDDDN